MKEKETTLEKFHQLIDEMHKNGESIFGIYIGKDDANGYDIAYVGSREQLETAFANILLDFCENSRCAANTKIAIALLDAIGDIIMSDTSAAPNIKEFLIRALSGKITKNEDEEGEEDNCGCHCGCDA